MNDPIYSISSLTFNAAKNCVNILFSYRYEGKLQSAFACIDYNDPTQAHLTRDLSELGYLDEVQPILIQAMRDSMYYVKYPERDIII